MLQYFFTVFLTSAILTQSHLSAEIIETNQIKKILPGIDENTLVLFNITEVLLDSSISLGSRPWRKYIEAKAPMWKGHEKYPVHDLLTLYVAKNIPPKAPESTTPQLIQDLQAQGTPVLAFTSRGRSQWYNLEVAGVDELTETMLLKLGYDLNQSQTPFVFIQQEGSYYLSHYRNGILYCEHMDKGPFLKKLLEDSGYRPSRIVFVDDKAADLGDVDQEMKDLGIPFTGFWYTRTKQDRVDFSPMVANIQLERLVFENVLLSDAEAQQIIDQSYADVDPDQFFIELLDKIASQLQAH